jgi:hypothetical protein
MNVTFPSTPTSNMRISHSSSTTRKCWRETEIRQRQFPSFVLSEWSGPSNLTVFWWSLAWNSIEKGVGLSRSWEFEEECNEFENLISSMRWIFVTKHPGEIFETEKYLRLFKNSESSHNEARYDLSNCGWD